MAITVQKATKIARTSLGLLEREIVLTTTVWRDAGGDFAGAKDDTITLRVPARVKARTRTMRGARPSASEGDGVIVLDNLAETKVDITLDMHIYSAVGVTDEELTLDVTDFAGQVTGPQLRGVVEGVEDALAAEMTGATYATTLTLNQTDPYKTAVAARKALNKANVPGTDRYLIVGNDVEEFFLNSDRLSKVDTSGWSETLREAVVGKIAGFVVLVSQAIPDTVAFAYHRTAFALSLQAPKVPQGATVGRSETFEGLALRWLLDYDQRNAQDRSMVDVFAGVNAVIDGTPTNEVQTLTMTGGPTGGTWTATLNGQTTGAIPFNAAASAVRTALEALSTIGAGNVTVTGANGGPYTVTFVGALAGANVNAMTASGAGLTGGTTPSVAVTTTQAGGVSQFVRAVKIVL
ncbi:hypothetical protein ACVDFE_02130 [Lentzea chajnantorensis]